MLPNTAPDLSTAARAGGRVACLSAARRHGWWIPPGVDEALHLHMTPNAVVGAVPEGTSVVRHWTRPLIVLPRDRLLESIEDTLAHLANCQPREVALTIWESATRIEKLSPNALRAVRWRTNAARQCAAASDGLSDSGLETIFVQRMRPFGLVLRQQVVLAGRPVDILIGEWLVVQIDGFAHHSSSADRTRDLRHDAELRLRGYTVLRFSYSQVIHDWRAVERTISRAVAAGLHDRTA